ncbi:unnamed protein product, partial [Musa banksii]
DQPGAFSFGFGLVWTSTFRSSQVADLRKRSKKCQLLAIMESKALIGETEMQQTMQQEALHQAGKALDLLDVTCVIKKQELDGISVAIISTGNIIQNQI